MDEHNEVSSKLPQVFSAKLSFVETSTRQDGLKKEKKANPSDASYSTSVTSAKHCSTGKSVSMAADLESFQHPPGPDVADNNNSDDEVFYDSYNTPGARPTSPSRTASGQEIKESAASGTIQFKDKTGRILDPIEKDQRKAERKEQKRLAKEAKLKERLKASREKRRQSRVCQLRSEIQSLEAKYIAEKDEQRKEANACLSKLEAELERRKSVLAACQEAVNQVHDDSDSDVDEQGMFYSSHITDWREFCDLPKVSSQLSKVKPHDFDADLDEQRFEKDADISAETDTLCSVEIAESSTAQQGPPPPKQMTVLMRKNANEGLGFLVDQAASYGLLPSVFISHIYPGTVAAEFGQLEVGDIILSVNGVSLVGMTLARAETVLGQTSRLNEVQLDIMRQEPVRTYKLDKRLAPEGILGFDVVDGDISKVVAGSPADAIGMQAGDHILQINGFSTFGHSNLEVFAMLKAPVLTLEVMTGPLYKMISKR